MTALPMNFDSVLQAFQHPTPLTRIDTVGCYVDGEWIEQDDSKGSMTGIVLAMPAVLSGRGRHET